MKNLKHLAKYFYLSLLLTFTSGCVIDSNYEDGQLLTVGGKKEFRIIFDDDTVIRSVTGSNIRLRGPSGPIHYFDLYHDGQTASIWYEDISQNGWYVLEISYDHRQEGRLMHFIRFKMNNLNNDRFLSSATVNVSNKRNSKEKRLSVRINLKGGEYPNSQDRVYLVGPDGRKYFPNYDGEGNVFIFDWDGSQCDGDKQTALFYVSELPEDHKYPDYLYLHEYHDYRVNKLKNGGKPIQMLKFVPCNDSH